MFKKIKNNKIKNTGIIFLILIKMISMLLVLNKKPQNAIGCLKKIFKHDSLMYKLWLLYKSLSDKDLSINKHNIKLYILMILNKRQNLINLKNLLKEKYNAISILKLKYDLKLFFNTTLLNYKKNASIYKLFLTITNVNLYDPILILNNKKVLSLCILCKSKDVLLKKLNLQNKLFMQQPKLVRIIANQLMIKTFNKKYLNLSVKQKLLLKLYIYLNKNKTVFVSKFKLMCESALIVLLKISTKNKLKIDLILHLKIINTINIIKLKVLTNRKLYLKNVNMLMNVYLLIKEIQAL